ncbi:TIGR04255 family protein [Blastococcus sp. BMG 814]|uniref:TIGR04255 family protein n=1 Tax=Blastococcus carthaginiensis TaxID=3050034 RepID=A0ABT9II84_9ACTN|nr:TIGR04255 family protein [Blastococcus carthaginiensis]MDP5184824.1 TIGR04255 family protein [Blastococcus carthaginiensis]
MTDKTGPLAGLPPADRTLLIAPPLELAVLEVRFVGDAADVPADVALAARERLAALGHSYVRQEQAQEGRIEIQMQPGAAPSSQVQQVARGWQLHSADGTSHITLLPSAVVLQTTRYERWSVTLRPVLEALVAVAEDLLMPSVVDRIGLRYIDRFVDAEARTPADWRGWIHPDLLGAACHPVFGAHVRGAQQQVELGLGEAQGALLRHGPFADPAVGGAVSYLVDIDVYDAESIRFDTAELVRRAEVLNRTAASLFQATLTPEYLRSLQRTDTPTDPATDTVEEGAR